MEKRSLFDDATYAEIVTRLDKLSADSTPTWGKMTVGQMLAHAAAVQEIGNGKDLKGTNLIARLFKGMIKKMLLSDKPFPHNSRTHPQFIVTAPAEFKMEKTRLIDAMESIRANGARPDGHPLFGPLTNDEWGWIYYKHLDHHLGQFGV